MKTKNIIIIVVVVIVVFIAYTKYAKPKTTTGSIIQKSGTIPASVEDHLRDFSEGEKMLFEGKEYQVSNGSWVAL